MLASDWLVMLLTSMFPFVRIKSDVVVLSCDSIIEINLYPLLSKFREKDASVQLLLLESGKDQDVVMPGPKSKYKAEKDIIGYDKATSRVLFMASASDFEETVKLSGHLLRENPDMIISSSMLDAHVYIMKKWVVEYLAVTELLSAVKGELLPHIIKKQLLQPPAVPENDGTSEYTAKPKVDDIFQVGFVFAKSRRNGFVAFQVPFLFYSLLCTRKWIRRSIKHRFSTRKRKQLLTRYAAMLTLPTRKHSD